jgi:hypothetical protein
MEQPVPREQKKKFLRNFKKDIFEKKFQKRKFKQEAVSRHIKMVEVH